MAAGAMATAAGAAVLFYYVLSRRLIASSKGGEDREGDDDVDQNGECLKTSRRRRLSRRMSRRPLQAPATWFEVMTTLSETIRFTYSETLGKWPIGDLAFGLNYFMRRQANLQVASVYAGGKCVLLKGPEIIAELNCLLRYITLCNLFSKKPFLVFLESAGYTEADVLLQKPKAALLKPAFTILCDINSKCLLLLIRGTHSIKDTLTAATGAVVPFHHSVLHDGGISNLVLGYAHCGMVAAARWIAKLSSPVLLKALEEYPDYKVKIVGHSLGGGTAALLTYILREQKEFSSVTCATFGPAACMTMDLAESGNDFITTVINGSDLVPTFSTASIDDLRSEVTASSWSNDLRDQVEKTRVLNVVYRSATALGSRLPSIASARARVVGAGALLRPVSSSTQVVMKRAQNVAEAVVRTRSSLSSWSCMGARRRNVGSLPSPQEDNSSLITERSAPGSIVTEVNALEKREYDSLNVGSIQDDTDEEEKLEIVDSTDIATSNADEMTEGELWYELERELHRKDLETDLHLKEEEEEEEAEAIQIAEEEIVLADAVESKTPICSSDVTENQHFYPPGKIMHMVSSIPVPTTTDDDLGHDLTTTTSEERVCIYETPRELYSKLRLTKTMINDHFMPMYQKTMKTLIRDLENEQVCDDCVM